MLYCLKNLTMTGQNFTNHRRYASGYHFLLSLLLLAGFIASIVNVVKQWQTESFVDAFLISLLFICGFLIFWYMRRFPLKAQDRAIRAEEGLRYFILTRQPLDNRLNVAQIAALRFAPDDELIPLITRAVAENLSPDEIKKAIKNWRADHHRV
jgi:Zn-dependent protease with chaperone function